MKVLLVSDTHKRMDRLYSIVKSLSDIDMIIHLGDHWQDASELEKRKIFQGKILSVGGNTDGFLERDKLYKVIDSPKGKIYLSHGHREAVDMSLMNIYYKALELDCKFVCFGHTHIPLDEEINGVRLINPGSLSKPRNIGSKGNYAILHISDDGIEVELREYEEGSKKRKSGGYIRGILNYSDRL